MRARPILLALALLASALGACWEMPPGNVALSAGAEEVEILTETPSTDVYESFQEITVQAIGTSNNEATTTAKHLLRNRGAELHARFVSVDDATASLAWDFSGRTIVTIRGRAFRVKEDPPPTRTYEPPPPPPPSVSWSPGSDASAAAPSVPADAFAMDAGARDAAAKPEKPKPATPKPATPKPATPKPVQDAGKGP